jgi:hypothetical protein
MVRYIGNPYDLIGARNERGYLNLGEGWVQLNPASAGGVSGLSFGSYNGIGSSFTMSGLGPGSTNYFSIISYRFMENNRVSGGDQDHNISPGGTGTNMPIARSAEGDLAPSVNNVTGLIFSPGTTISPYSLDQVGIDVVYAATLGPLVAAGFDSKNLVPETGCSHASSLTYTSNINGLKIWMYDESNGGDASGMNITDSGGTVFDLVESFSPNLRVFGSGITGRIYLPAGYGFSSDSGAGGRSKLYYELL